MTPPGSGYIIVLGMHRSGTSALANVLADSGVQMGRGHELENAPDPRNRGGHWELFRLVEINEQLLESWGGSWCDPNLSRSPPSHAQLPSALWGEMEKLAEAWKRRSEVWGWKDPRLCLTWPYWRPVLPDAAFLWCNRNPLEVAASLGARDGIPERAGLALWELYTRSAARFVRERPYQIVHFHRLLESPELAVEELHRFLEAHTTLGPWEESRRTPSIARDRRHQVIQQDAFFESDTPTATQKAIYGALLAGALPPDLDSPQVVEVDVLTELLGLAQQRGVRRLTGEQRDYWQTRYERLAGTFPVSTMLWVRRRLQNAMRRARARAARKGG